MTPNTQTTSQTRKEQKRNSAVLMRWMRPLLASGTITLFTFMLLAVYLSPFGYMVATAFKDRDMIATSDAPIWPAKPAKFEYNGEELSIYQVPFEDGRTEALALSTKRREESFFIDPNNPEAGEIRWEGRWRTLEPEWEFSPQWDNFQKAWTELNMPILLRNTISIAVIGMVGTLVSCIAVAYGFSRFRFPGKNIMFMILIATIILPSFVTLVPTYTLFQRIGWVGTWLPLLIPHFFANAYNVFLLRQFFMSIPKELDEAAMIDGAGPVRTLVSIILPQAIPAIVSVGILHFVWAWNDYFSPLIYLSTKPELQPIAIGIQTYNALYFAKPHMVQASSLLGLIVPVLLFFSAQRFFMQGVKFTGVEK